MCIDARIVVTVAGVQGAGQRVLVALEGVVLGAPDVVAEVGVAIPVSGTRVVTCRNIVCVSTFYNSMRRRLR